MNSFLKDVLNQPDSLRESLDALISNGSIEKLKGIDGRKFEKIIFTGMGSSHFCNYGASILLNQMGFLSMVMSASEVLHYETNLINEKTLLVLVSQSGESGEIVKLIGKIPTTVTVVAITNNPNSTLGRRGDYTFLLNVAEEESVTTRTYLSSLMIADLLAKALVGQLNEDFINDARNLIDNLEGFLSTHAETSAKIKEFISEPPYFCIIGRGYSLSSVRAGALFIREVAKYPSLDFDGGEFRHGPYEMINKNFYALIFATDGPTYEINVGLAVNIAKHNGKAILVTNRNTEIKDKNILVIEQKASSEFLAPIIEIAPLQLLANILAESKNLEVGKFLLSSKITNVEQ
jgi:glutamine---fructose-6-phosphate transaminase (isomerizing)